MGDWEVEGRRERRRLCSACDEEAEPAKDRGVSERKSERSERRVQS